MRYMPLYVKTLVVGLGLIPGQGFLAPKVPCAIVDRGEACSSATTAASKDSTSGGCCDGIRSIHTKGRSRAAGFRSRPAAAGTKLRMAAATPAEEEGDGGGDNGGENKEAGVLAATGATGAFLGWNFAHSLGLGQDMAGALTGCLAAIGLLAQEGAVGDVTAKVGEFALGAFDIVSVVAERTGAPAKIAGTVGEELLEVVEFTSGAVTKLGGNCDAEKCSVEPLKRLCGESPAERLMTARAPEGYLENLPDAELRLEAEISKSKRTVEDLKKQIEKVTSALAEAKEQLKERAASQRVVKAAEATAAELAAAKAIVKEKDAEITETLKRARHEKEALAADLKAARAETARFRKMVESRADMDDNYTALSEASETLEDRVREYEARLRLLAEENDGIRADYTAEVKSMEAERASMRETIASLETALKSSEIAIDQQRADMEAELSKMTAALEEQTAAADKATALATEMKMAVQKSLEEKGQAVEKATAEMKAAEAAKRAAAEEQARAAQEVKAAKEAEAKSLKAAVVKGKAKPKTSARARSATATRAKAATSTKAKASATKVAPAAAAGAGAEAAGMSKDVLAKSTVKALREQCKAAGVPTSGKKSDLVERLMEASLATA